MSMPTNPYDPPRAPIGMVDEYQPLEIASKGRRFGTFICDYIVSFVCTFILDIGIFMVVGQESYEKMAGGLFLINIFAALGYYVFFEGIWGRTPGKLICGTKVVDQDGGPASFGQILGRTACRCIPFEPFSFFGSRGWHDSIPKTSVVMAR